LVRAKGKNASAGDKFPATLITFVPATIPLALLRGFDQLFTTDCFFHRRNAAGYARSGEAPGGAERGKLGKAACWPSSPKS
jgi:hypothetical protein